MDSKACEALNIPIINTPGIFGGEVADVAVGYVIVLARHTVKVDSGARDGTWPKPRGLSLAGRSVAVVGYGSILSFNDTKGYDAIFLYSYYSE